MSNYILTNDHYGGYYASRGMAIDLKNVNSRIHCTTEENIIYGGIGGLTYRNLRTGKIHDNKNMHIWNVWNLGDNLLLVHLFSGHSGKYVFALYKNWIQLCKVESTDESKVQVYPELNYAVITDFKGYGKFKLMEKTIMKSSTGKCIFGNNNYASMHGHIGKFRTYRKNQILWTFKYTVEPTEVYIGENFVCTKENKDVRIYTREWTCAHSESQYVTHDQNYVITKDNNNIYYLLTIEPRTTIQLNYEPSSISISTDIILISDINQTTFYNKSTMKMIERWLCRRSDCCYNCPSCKILDNGLKAYFTPCNNEMYRTMIKLVYDYTRLCLNTSSIVANYL